MLANFFFLLPTARSAELSPKPEPIHTEKLFSLSNDRNPRFTDFGEDSGEVTIKFVYNGIFKTYRDCTFKLKHEKGRPWQAVQIVSGDSVTTPRTVTRALGIERIQGICR